jgi:hypothetical protein
MKLTTSRGSQIVSVVALAVGFGLLVLVVLSLTGAISLCGKKERKAGGSSKSGSKSGSAGGPQQQQHKNSPPPAAPARSPSSPPAPPAGSPPTTPKSASSPQVNGPSASQLIDLEGPAAVELVRNQGRDKVLYVLGQMGCPACQACKKYLKEQNHGDVTVFVDIAIHGDMMTNGSLPKPVTSSLGRGVPCLVAYSHRAGAVMKKNEGFSPKAVEEMVALVKA